MHCTNALAVTYLPSIPKACTRPTRRTRAKPTSKYAMQTLDYWTLRVAVWRWLLLVDPRVFWAPGPAVGPGCSVYPWAAARPGGPSGALRTGGAFGADVARRIALMPSYGCQPAIPHVIPR